MGISAAAHRVEPYLLRNAVRHEGPGSIPEQVVARLRVSGWKGEARTAASQYPRRYAYDAGTDPAHAHDVLRATAGLYVGEHALLKRDGRYTIVPTKSTAQNIWGYPYVSNNGRGNLEEWSVKPGRGVAAFAPHERYASFERGGRGWHAVPLVGGDEAKVPADLADVRLRFANTGGGHSDPAELTVARWAPIRGTLEQALAAARFLGAAKGFSTVVVARGDTVPEFAGVVDAAWYSAQLAQAPEGAWFVGTLEDAGRAHDSTIAKWLFTSEPSDHLPRLGPGSLVERSTPRIVHVEGGARKISWPNDGLVA